MQIDRMRLGELVQVKQPFPLAPATATALGNHTGIQQGVVADLSRLQLAYRLRITTAALQAKAAASAPGS